MPAKKTTEQFIKDAKEKRTDIDFDYSKVNYINSFTKVTIIDPEFGEFDITPNHFLSGSGHPIRGGSSKKTTEQFIKDAKEKRTDIDFEYSKAEYVNYRTKVTIIDPEYGEFSVTPSNFLSGSGHPSRSINNDIVKKTKTTEQFIKEAKEKRSDIDFDYSKVNYINSFTKVTIIDPEFGEFDITPKSFLSGSGHPIRGGSSKKTTEQFIKDAKEKRTDIDFEYSKVNYVNNKTKVTVIDPEYGEFDITPNSFLRGCGHPRRGGKAKKTTEQFIKDAKEKRTDIDFEYSKVNYVNNKTKVTVIDPEYGEFSVTPDDFLRGSGHPLRAGYSQQYAYVNIISDNDLPIALKYGIEKQKGKRVKQQNKKSLFKVKLICVYCFPTVINCKEAEKECKKLFGNGILSKHEMPDGYTETTTIANLEKIIYIYEKWGGVKQ